MNNIPQLDNHEKTLKLILLPPKVATSAVVSAGDVGNIALLVLGCLSTWLAAGAGNINNIRGDGGGGNIARGDGVINNNDINNNGGDNSSG